MTNPILDLFNIVGIVCFARVPLPGIDGNSVAIGLDWQL
ncbi:MAG: Uncharacterised protein [Prochlorococcus marinus str. MIT 9215]|nr:MAG: Uncharacterised protein [Prochlorococcus marinus str. MIT 9215]